VAVASTNACAAGSSTTAVSVLSMAMSINSWCWCCLAGGPALSLRTGRRVVP